MTAANAGAEPVNPNTAEALKDFAAIAQIDNSEEESDEGDTELENLIEYLRIAALNIVTDTLSYQV